jgi:segregation and condensation protein B
MEPTDQAQPTFQDETRETEAERPQPAGAETADSPALVDVSECAGQDQALPADLLAAEPAGNAPDADDARLKAMLEAIIYVTEEPLTAPQLAAGLGEPREKIERLLAELVADYEHPGRGVTIREVAGGYKMATKPEHHDAVRAFVKSLKAPLKLSLAALETLAVIAYKQPVTAPEIMEIRGVQGAGVLKTLLDRKLIATAGRKNVIGKPILYRTSKEFLIQFGLKDLSELPSLKEFEELRRLAINDTEPPAEGEDVEPAEQAAEAVAAEDPEDASGSGKDTAPPAAAEEPESVS